MSDQNGHKKSILTAQERHKLNMFLVTHKDTFHQKTLDGVLGEAKTILPHLSRISLKRSLRIVGIQVQRTPRKDKNNTHPTARSRYAALEGRVGELERQLAELKSALGVG